MDSEVPQGLMNIEQRARIKEFLRAEHNFIVAKLEEITARFWVVVREGKCNPALPDYLFIRVPSDTGFSICWTDRWLPEQQLSYIRKWLQTNNLQNAQYTATLDSGRPTA